MKFAIKLSFIFILVGSIPLFFGGVFLLSFFNDHLENVVRENLITNVGVRAQEVVRFLDHKTEQAERMTKNIENYINCVTEDENQEVTETEKPCIGNEISDAYSDYNMFFENFFILDEKGSVVFSQTEDNTMSWGSSRWFDDVKEKKETIISDVILDDKKQNLKLAILTPLSSDLEHYVVSEISIANFFQIFENEIRNNCCIFLVNSDGDILFSRNEEMTYRKIDESYPLRESFEKGKGSVDFYFNGEKNIGGFYVVDGVMWQIILLQPEKEIFGFLWIMAANYFTLIVILLLPIILSSFLISRKIMKPLKNISAVSKRVAMGDLNVRAKVMGKDEFSELAENFNKMTGEVKRVREVIEKEKKELEGKVKERTKELAELNNVLELKIQERTKDMGKKMIELEKMSKLMVGRESKMIELKKKMKEMEMYIEKLKEKNS